MRRSTHLGILAVLALWGAVDGLHEAVADEVSVALGEASEDLLIASRRSLSFLSSPQVGCIGVDPAVCCCGGQEMQKCSYGSKIEYGFHNCAYLSRCQLEGLWRMACFIKLQDWLREKLVVSGRVMNAL